ncbi:hypothetical protein WKW79_34665 [Variovorax robiniae]|uniref:Uncharacterized protein n=1 Tax=Variovorax robiniae TaxID=1836199 RepID=A0ABU8XIN7_9BURK
MALEAMHDALYARLDYLVSSKAKKADWQCLWSMVQANPGEPIPCPVCLVEFDRVSGVNVRPDVGDLAAARCELCGTWYHWFDAH